MNPENPLENLPEGLRDLTTGLTSDRDTVLSSIILGDPEYKPYPFALRPAPNGNIHIYYGVLVHQINRMVFDATGFVSQTGVTNPETFIPANFTEEPVAGVNGPTGPSSPSNFDNPSPSNFDDPSPDAPASEEAAPEGNRYKFYTLDWRGNVYLYWETDSAGVVTLCDIRGKDGEPEHKAIPDPEDPDAGGKFFVKIGNVANYDVSGIDQNISTDVYWVTAFAVQEETSTSGSGGDGGSTSDGGSDKSTAIVPMDWHDKGYGALFTMESNEVLFEFVLRDVPVTGAATRVRIDDRFLAVCEKDSMVVTGIAGDKAGSIGAVVEDNEVILSAWPLTFLRPTKATLKLTGVRKGFRHLDMPERSKGQFTANEKFINSAYPR